MTNFAPYLNDMWLPSNKIPGLLVVWSVVALSILLGCAKENVPKDILTQDQLTTIMIEFYLGEAKLSNYSLPYDSASKLFIPFEAAVLKKYGVSDSSLLKTYQYYFHHPKKLEKIYEIVIDSLNLRERKAGGMPTTDN